MYCLGAEHHILHVREMKECSNERLLCRQQAVLEARAKPGERLARHSVTQHAIYVCTQCDKPGHLAGDCKEPEGPAAKRQNPGSSQEAVQQESMSHGQGGSCWLCGDLPFALGFDVSAKVCMGLSRDAVRRRMDYSLPPDAVGAVGDVDAASDNDDNNDNNDYRDSDQPPASADRAAKAGVKADQKAAADRAAAQLSRLSKAATVLLAKPSVSCVCTNIQTKVEEAIAERRWLSRAHTIFTLHEDDEVAAAAAKAAAANATTRAALKRVTPLTTQLNTLSSEVSVLLDEAKGAAAGIEASVSLDKGKELSAVVGAKVKDIKEKMASARQMVTAVCGVVKPLRKTLRSVLKQYGEYYGW